MIAHGIPVRWTHRLANALGIQGVEDLATVQFDMIMHVPTAFRQRVMDLRNFYRDDNATMWTTPSDY